MCVFLLFPSRMHGSGPIIVMGPALKQTNDHIKLSGTWVISKIKFWVEYSRRKQYRIGPSHSFNSLQEVYYPHFHVNHVKSHGQFIVFPNSKFCFWVATRRACLELPTKNNIKTVTAERKLLLKGFLAGKTRVYRILSQKQKQKQKLTQVGIQSFCSLYVSFTLIFGIINAKTNLSIGFCFIEATLRD